MTRSMTVVFPLPDQPANPKIRRGGLIPLDADR
jgi:hypothetical protein